MTITQTLKLPEASQKIIDSYLKMSISDKVIICPYFTNLQKARGGLRVFLGKATAQEIINEVKFVAQKEQVDLTKISEKELYQFMVKHNLGIDCSGFAVHVLKAFYEEKKKIHPVKCRSAAISLKAKLFNRVDILKKIKVVSFFKNPFRYLISKMRPVENINVKILADNKNSFLIKDFSKILPGDMLIRKNLRHVYLIAKIEKDNDVIRALSYIHAPRPKQKDYFGPGIEQKTIILRKNSLEELKEKIKDDVVIRRLKF